MPRKLSPKDRILKERGLLEYRPAPRKHRRHLPIEIIYGGKPKTALMRYLEQKYGQTIEELLLSGSLSVVAKKLGNEVDNTTLSKWIKRFNLRYHADNLPECKGCKHYGLACQGGICLVLVQLELYDLIPIMKEKLLEGD